MSLTVLKQQMIFELYFTFQVHIKYRTALTFRSDTFIVN